MSSEGEADAAFNSLQGKDLNERAIKIEKATPQVPRDPSAETAPRRGGRGGRRGRGSRRTPAPGREGPASTTVIYVGNLPYVAESSDLTTVFADYNVVKAHVVRRADGSSKGFGFVTVKSEADQQRALSELAGVVLDKRTLNIRAAMSEESYDERQAKLADA